MDIAIERTCPEDAQDLIECRNKSFYDDYIKFGECPGYNIPVDTIKKIIKDGLVYKILADGKVIGDISVQDLGEGYYWIGCLEIIPEFQNKGVGSKVLKCVEELHPEAKRWGLDTPVQNERNCWFYEKMGFIKVEDRVHSETLTLRVYDKRV